MSNPVSRSSYWRWVALRVVSTESRRRRKFISALERRFLLNWSACVWILNTHPASYLIAPSWAMKEAQEESASFSATLSTALLQNDKLSTPAGTTTAEWKDNKIAFNTVRRIRIPFLGLTIKKLAVEDLKEAKAKIWPANRQPLHRLGI